MTKRIVLYGIIAMALIIGIIRSADAYIDGQNHLIEEMVKPTVPPAAPPISKFNGPMVAKNHPKPKIGIPLEIAPPMDNKDDLPVCVQSDPCWTRLITTI